MLLPSLKPKYLGLPSIKYKTIVTHNNFRHCRVYFYAFVRQPFSKQLYIKVLNGDSSEIKVADEFFESFPECSLPSTVSKNTIKMIGHHSCLRDVMGQSYLICACTRTNHARYSSVHVTFCGSSKHSLQK